MSAERIIAIMPDAIAFALLGSIESLLSAVVADGMTGRRHKSNSELLGQGIANIGSALFGGICVTGTIARTATNVRSGGRTPVAGMLHSLFLLGFMLVAARWPATSPWQRWRAGSSSSLGTWSSVTLFRRCFAVAWRCGGSVGNVPLVVFRDLTEGIVVGFALGALFLYIAWPEPSRSRKARRPCRLSGRW